MKRINIFLMCLFTLVIAGCGSSVNVTDPNLNVMPTAANKPAPGYLDDTQVAFSFAPMRYYCEQSRWFSWGAIWDQEATMQWILNNWPTFNRIYLYPPQLDLSERSDYAQLEEDYTTVIHEAQATGKQVVLNTLPYFYGSLASKNHEVDRLNALATYESYKDNTWLVDLAKYMPSEDDWLQTATIFPDAQYMVASADPGCLAIKKAYSDFNK